jgi:predicted dehydrogenase
MQGRDTVDRDHAMPSRFASSLPLSSSATPAQSVTSEASPKSNATRVVEEAATRGLPLGVVHPLRARQELDELRQRVENGTEQVRQVAGRLYLHRLENVGSTGYRRSWTDNLLWHHMAHVVDASLWVCGTPEVEVKSAMSSVDKLTGIPMDVAVLMRTELGQPLLCSGSYYARERIRPAHRHRSRLVSARRVCVDAGHGGGPTACPP